MKGSKLMQAFDIHGVKLEKFDIWLEDVNGINYYRDNDGNVYKVKDILAKVDNPTIVGKLCNNCFVKGREGGVEEEGS